VFVRVDVATGAQTIVANPLNMETMDYDPLTGLIYGVGLKVDSPTNFYRVMLSLDSSNNTFAVLGMVILSLKQLKELLIQ